MLKLPRVRRCCSLKGRRAAATSPSVRNVQQQARPAVGSEAFRFLSSFKLFPQNDEFLILTLRNLTSGVLTLNHQIIILHFFLHIELYFSLEILFHHFLNYESISSFLLLC